LPIVIALTLAAGLLIGWGPTGEFGSMNASNDLH
jgi:hypothetical protein